MPMLSGNGEIIIVREHVPLDNIPPDRNSFRPPGLFRDLKARGQEAYYFTGTDDILDFLADHARPGDVIAVLSNGGFDNIHERLLARLSRNTVQ